jgi:hypothetical protein
LIIPNLLKHKYNTIKKARVAGNETILEKTAAFIDFISTFCDIKK